MELEIKRNLKEEKMLKIRLPKGAAIVKGYKKNSPLRGR